MSSKKQALYNPIERMIHYRTMIGTGYADTITSLSASLDVPIDIVRRDIDVIIGSDQPFILPADDGSTIDDNSILEVIDLYDDDFTETVSIPVDIDEYLAYQNLFEQKTMPKKESGETKLITRSIRNKKYVYDLPPYVLETLDSIETAITDKMCIKFDYKTNASCSRSIMACPALIGFNASESNYVLIAFIDKTPQNFDMENISNIRITREIPYSVNNSYFKNADKVWGFEFDKCLDNAGKQMQPTRVSVKFYDEANVLEKLARDLTYRKPLELRKTRSGEMIYTDDVYGLDSFKKWVYSYGSSAEILKPAKLRNQFAEELKAFCNISKA